MPSLRPSTDADVRAVTAIYAHHVLHGTGTFEIDPPTEADMAARRADVLGHVGMLASCGWKFGRWLDVVMMDKALGEGDRTPPAAA